MDGGGKINLAVQHPGGVTCGGMLTSLALYLGILALGGGSAWGLVRLARRFSWLGLVEDDQRDHFRSVDGLRGLLALGVFVHHAWCLRNLLRRDYWTSEGDTILTNAAIVSVTLFFFITGFVFWSKLQRTPRLQLRVHLRSRLARLAPAYWMTLVAITAIVVLDSRLASPEPITGLIGAGASLLLFTVVPGGTEHLTPIVWRMFNSIVWTLRLEWIFYLLIPWCGWFAGAIWRGLLFCLGLFGLHVFTVLLNVGAILPGVVPVWLQPSAERTTAYLAYSFTGGILAACFRPWLAARLSGVRWGGAWMSAAGLGLVMTTLLTAEPEYGWQVSVRLLVPFALITLGNDWFGLLTCAPVRLLGRVSYSIYLLHIVVLYLAFHYLNVVYPVREIPPLAYWSIIGLLTVILTAVSAWWYLRFERPFLRIGAAAPVAPKVQ